MEDRSLEARSVAIIRLVLISHHGLYSEYNVHIDVKVYVDAMQVLKKVRSGCRYPPKSSLTCYLGTCTYCYFMVQ